MTANSPSDRLREGVAILVRSHLKYSPYSTELGDIVITYFYGPHFYMVCSRFWKIFYRIFKPFYQSW